jgi:hypothetical protein
LVDVSEELAGRELNDIVESRGCRDDRTAIGQLSEACQWLVARKNLVDKSSITNLRLLLTQETHFEEGLTELFDHQAVVNWK